MERTLASFPWPGYDSIRSWGSQVCVCVSPRFVSAPGHAGHAPASLSFSPPIPLPPSFLSTSMGGERSREREETLSPRFRSARGEAVPRTDEQTHPTIPDTLREEGRGGEQTHRDRSRYTTGCAVALPRVQGGRHHPSPLLPRGRGGIFGSRRGMHATDV